MAMFLLVALLFLLYLLILVPGFLRGLAQEDKRELWVFLALFLLGVTLSLPPALGLPPPSPTPILMRLTDPLARLVLGPP